MIDLFPYQVAGANWLASQSHAMLWDQMRLGKTPQAIRACNIVGAKRVLVICPAVARNVWRRGFANWSLYPIAPMIVSYDKWARQPLAYDEGIWDVVILDEAHYLKTRTAKRTESIYGKGTNGAPLKMAQRVWALTGTPCPNHAAELWTHLRAMFPKMLTSPVDTLRYDDFVKRYCVTMEGNYGPIFLRNKNVDELKDKLRGITLRRTMAEVFSELPKVRFFEEALVDERRAGTFEEDFEDGMELPTATERREVGERKAPLAAQRILEDLEEPGHKAVAFAYHKSVIAELREKLSKFNAMSLDGSSTEAQRDKAIQLFQNSPDHQVIVLQIDAFHSAIDLSAAHTVEIVEPSWVPEINVQAAWRCMNIAQRMPVTARMFSLANTLDDAIIRTLARKASMLSELMGE